MTFKSQYNIDTIVVKFVPAEEEYAEYLNRFALRTDNSGNILFRYYDANGETAITSVEMAQEYIKINLITDSLIKISSVLFAIQLFISLIILLMNVFQRQSCMFCILAIASSLIKVLVTYGLPYQMFFLGLGLEFIAFGLVLRDLKYINIENEKIANRDQYYK